MAVALVLSLPPAAHADVDVSLWNGSRAMAHIEAQLRFTPRSMDMPGHQRTIDYIKAELAKSGLTSVTTQDFVYRGTSKPLALFNIIARLNPENPRRVIVATHYDSIIRAYRDARNPQAAMPGANNSASGVALLLETARVLSASPQPPVGIDLIFFDGEEGPKSLGAGDPDWHPIGSPHFVEHLNDYYPNRKPDKAVDFDMVCKKDILLMPEASSVKAAPAEVKTFWELGAAIAPKAFSSKITYPISDDHTALNEAGISSFLVIDFEYEPYFNTSQDTFDKCSAESLEAVGRTLLRYLYLP
ncbi:M28 family peptidase [Bradyrhizobium sp.]|uniref:M28 family peptidase n=1 Tax=Bradyrhizobium sp. TaxID=376 RepID=UPI0025BB818F|nr:M28 family peptidase [Bradyrhizobium sp.]